MSGLSTRADRKSAAAGLVGAALAALAILFLLSSLAVGLGPTRGF